MFLFCSIKVKGSRWTISRSGARSAACHLSIEIVATSVLVDVGEKGLSGSGRLWLERQLFAALRQADQPLGSLAP